MTRSSGPLLKTGLIFESDAKELLNERKNSEQPA